jgi:hypothetical protein
MPSFCHGIHKLRAVTKQILLISRHTANINAVTPATHAETGGKLFRVSRHTQRTRSQPACPASIPIRQYNMVFSHESLPQSSQRLTRHVRKSTAKSWRKNPLFLWCYGFFAKSSLRWNVHTAAHGTKQFRLDNDFGVLTGSDTAPLARPGGQGR